METVNCDTFTLTVDPTSNWTGKRVQVRIQQATADDDTDLVIHKGDNNGPIIATSGNGAGITEAGFINPNTDGTGPFTVHVIYFATVPGDQYHGNAEVVPLVPAPPPNAIVDTTNHIGYENFEAPGVITPVTVTTGPTVEWLGRNAGEPSIGINWQSPGSANGVTNMQSDLETLFINFSNTPANGGGATATWANRPAPTQTVIDSDPIGFTDVVTGRVFAGELSATSPSCKISYTTTDGQPPGPTGWTATTGPLGSGIDHETIGGGHYNESALPPPVHPLYANAIYYCSQDLVTAFCLRSDDGGQTFPPANQSDTYTTECGGLHGHVKVSPAADGTVYLPNKDCSGNEAAVVSENNGVTWSIRPVSNASVQPGPSSTDPAVAVDANGRAYFAMAANDSAAVVAFSDDHGVTWQNIVNVSAALGLQNVRSPAAVAGDANRAAVAFYGTTAAGDANSSAFNGVWHLYVSHTFDGGLTWTTSDATPNMPVQRGNIWTGGGANIGRNLLDFFDIAIDKVGRVQIGYVNGCAGGNCAQAAPSATGNAYSATATIARQSSGKRLLAASDGVTGGTTAPGMPFITARRIGSVVHLAWSEADSGSSAITGYQILRGTVSGAESATPIANLSGTQNTYDDLTATDPAKTYYYKVIATNATGPSLANNEISAPFVGDTCRGILIHQNDPAHPESVLAQTDQQRAIDYVKVAEPGGGNTFAFTMKVTNLNTVPSDSRWRIVWDSFTSPGQQYYVGMTTDSSSTVTFEYGTIATAVVGLVVGVPTETMVGSATGSFNANGIITITVPKSAVGNPQIGDLLGAVNGRTFNTGDTPGGTTFERSTNLVDHTFVKAQTDNTYPTATYTVAGNNICALPVPTAVSRKFHGTDPTPRDIPLPLVGPPGIECRAGTPSGKDFEVLITFPASITLDGVTVTSSDRMATATESLSGNVVTVDLHNVSNMQTIAITLTNVNGLGNVSVPMGVLLGDTTGDGSVSGADVTQTKAQAGNLAHGDPSANFRQDVTVDGSISGADVTLVKRNAGNQLP
ncbi:MAG: exo-alpha-sialidase [Chthoniobacterales bacterium]